MARQPQKRRTSSADMDARFARAEAEGYVPEAHREEDNVRGLSKHTNKTKKEHDRVLMQYVQWKCGLAKRHRRQDGGEVPDKAAIRAACLANNVVAPDLATIKKFLRFYALGCKGLLNKHASADSTCIYAEWFFTGFQRVTGTSIDETERTDVYRWIRQTLTSEGIVVHKRKEKHLFTQKDLDNIFLAL